jgi:hypothetical protein
MATDIGVDISSYPDYDPLGTLVSGNVALAQRLARRFTNPRGAWSWAPNECYDLRSLLNEIITTDKLSEFKSIIEREALREEVVQTANAVVSWNASTSVLSIHLLGTTTSGSFNFVFGVGSATLEILAAG